MYEQGQLLAEGAQLTFSNMGAMDYVLAVVALLGGLGAFLFGFKVLSDNTKSWQPTACAVGSTRRAKTALSASASARA